MPQHHFNLQCMPGPAQTLWPAQSANSQNMTPTRLWSASMGLARMAMCAGLLLCASSIHEWSCAKVAALYGTGSRFLWRGDEGKDHCITQGEGGEQGNPLLPALFALAQHDALETAARRRTPHLDLRVLGRHQCRGQQGRSSNSFQHCGMRCGKAGRS